MRLRDLNDLLLKKFNGINNDNQVLGFPSKKNAKKCIKWLENEIIIKTLIRG